VELAKAAERAIASQKRRAFATTSTYSPITGEQWEEIVRPISGGVLQDLQRSFRPFVTLYPRCPFLGLWRDRQPPLQDDDVQVMRRHVANLLNRGARPAMLAQANAIFISVVTGKLSVYQGSTLSNIEAITDYPDTEESRRVGSAIRAAAIALRSHNDDEEQHATAWTRYFWQRGVEITPCDLTANDDDG
jgi:hypothetical protein